MPEIEEIDDEEAQKVIDEQAKQKASDEAAYAEAVKESDRRRTVDNQNQTEKQKRNKRIEDQKAKTQELIKKLGKVEIPKEDDPDFLFKMPAPNAAVNVKETGYEIFMSEEKGRGIRATKDFRVGNLIISAEPFAYVLFEAMAEHVCHQCFNMVIRDKQGQPTTQLLRCSSCKFSRYCSRECQKKAWKTHKKECMAIKVTTELKFILYITESEGGLFAPNLIFSQSPVVYAKIGFIDRLEINSGQIALSCSRRDLCNLQNLELIKYVKIFSLSVLEMTTCFVTPKPN